MCVCALIIVLAGSAQFAVSVSNREYWQRQRQRRRIKSILCHCQHLLLDTYYTCIHIHMHRSSTKAKPHKKKFSNFSFPLYTPSPFSCSASADWGKSFSCGKKVLPAFVRTLCVCVSHCAKNFACERCAIVLVVVSVVVVVSATVVVVLQLRQRLCVCDKRERQNRMRSRLRLQSHVCLCVCVLSCLLCCSRISGCERRQTLTRGRRKKIGGQTELNKAMENVENSFFLSLCYFLPFK